MLIVTGHLGAWELSSYYHSLMGYPMSLVIRRLYNAVADVLVNAICCLHGNRVVHKDEFVCGLPGAMRQGETVGDLMDTNMTPPQGVFVPKLWWLACMVSGPALVAAKTGCGGAAGVHGLGRGEKKDVLRFGGRDPGGFDRR